MDIVSKFASLWKCNYEVDGKIYFGELTLSHWSGAVAFEPEEWDMKFGEWIKLPK